MYTYVMDGLRARVTGLYYSHG